MTTITLEKPIKAWDLPDFQRVETIPAGATIVVTLDNPKSRLIVYQGRKMFSSKSAPILFWYSAHW